MTTLLKNIIKLRWLLRDGLKSPECIITNFARTVGRGLYYYVKNFPRPVVESLWP